MVGKDCPTVLYQAQPFVSQETPQTLASPHRTKTKQADITLQLPYVGGTTKGLVLW